MSREDLLRGLPRRPVPSAGGGLAAASAGPHLEGTGRATAAYVAAHRERTGAGLVPNKCVRSCPAAVGDGLHTGQTGHLNRHDAVRGGPVADFSPFILSPGRNGAIG